MAAPASTASRVWTRLVKGSAAARGYGPDITRRGGRSPGRAGPAGRCENPWPYVDAEAADDGADLVRSRRTRRRSRVPSREPAGRWRSAWPASDRRRTTSRTKLPSIFSSRDRQRLQVGERAQAPAEVVERDAEAEFAQPADQRLGADDVRDRGGLGQLERKQPGRQSALRAARRRGRRRNPGRRATVRRCSRRSRRRSARRLSACSPSVASTRRTTQRSMAGASW